MFHPSVHVASVHHGPKRWVWGVGWVWYSGAHLWKLSSCSGKHSDDLACLFVSVFPLPFSPLTDMSGFPGLHLLHLYSQNDLAFYRNTRDCACIQTHRELTGYYDVGAQLLDRIQIPRNQCSDCLHDTLKHATGIDSANAYLTLAWGSRCSVVSSACLLLPPPALLYVDVMFGSVMWNKMPHQMSDYWVTCMPSGCYYANPLRRYSLEIRSYKRRRI